MINLWRYVHYTDDGCALYECLQCYGRWEARSEPGYIHHQTGEYVASWHFCPFCGTQWTGKRTTDAERLCDRALGPRRARVYEAMEQLPWEQRWGTRYQPPFYWQLEYRQCWNFFGRSIENEKWTVRYWIKGLSMPVTGVLAHLRIMKEQLEADVAERHTITDADTMEKMQWTTQVRITHTRTQPNDDSELTRVPNA